jgi:hypothetical protein
MASNYPFKGNLFSSSFCRPGVKLGVFVLYHMSRQSIRNPDQYFPAISKMIKRGKVDKNVFTVRADNISEANSMEKGLIDVIRTLAEKKIP